MILDTFMVIWFQPRHLVSFFIFNRYLYFNKLPLFVFVTVRNLS